MPRPNQLTEIVVPDPPAAWAAAGFTMAAGVIDLGATRIRCARSPETGGLVSIAVDGLSDIDELDGIPLHHTPPIDPTPGVHPNGIDHLDHLVVMTPHADRTADVLATAGLDARRTRTFGRPGAATRQTFYWLGDTILEVVGPDAGEGAGPAELWGLAFTSPDLDATASSLGDRCGPISDAVQPGRRIATVRTADLGIGVPIAVMSPHTEERAS